MRGRVFIIAGSDSGGGAGIQADIKTVSALDGFAATAITALTAQNTQGVHGVHPVPTQFIKKQIDVVLSDIGADCIKIGMLHDTPTIETVTEVLRSTAAEIPLVVDPVITAKGGGRLLAEDSISALLKELVPLATLLTPNIPEAEALTNLQATDELSLQKMGAELLSKGAHAVLLKGGHLPGSLISDYLFTSKGVKEYQNSRIDTNHTHGTGCTLASAIAAGVAVGLSLFDAVERAEKYLQKAIISAPGFGAGHGPINHTHTFGSKI
ncbi:MAG: bifunctional hydroxymethylpyrimidine kinase/phosphomethylpyrimidine kinase [Rhodospirillaceae bacterium]|nr:bifunctional hydroxymethylpyrimidine kinase/phosphomethylpyrimidine kinase [Rhodospirillaceae bacterium]|tara:strand:- start:1733 stop:2533 length:801 start_codon:yes stop_codon:yes gene_type:complete